MPMEWETVGVVLEHQPGSYRLKNVKNPRMECNQVVSFKRENRGRKKYSTGIMYGLIDKKNKCTVHWSKISWQCTVGVVTDSSNCQTG